MRTCVRHCTIPAQGARGRHRRVAQGYHPFCGRGTGRGRERDGGHARPCVRDPLIGTATEGALFAPAPTGVSAATHPPADPVDQQLLWGDGGGCAPCAHQAVPRRTRSRSADTASLVCELPLRVPLSLGRRLAANLEAARRRTTPASVRPCGGGAWCDRRCGSYGDGPRLAGSKSGRPTSAPRAISTSSPLRRCNGIRVRSKGETGATAEKTWNGEHLGAHEVQALASRAYRATSTDLLGQHGQPRFKGNDQMHSVEGQGPGSGLRWTDHSLLIWGDLVLRPLIDPDDQVVRHALCSRVEYVRSVRRRVRLRTRWYVRWRAQSGRIPNPGMGWVAGSQSEKSTPQPALDQTVAHGPDLARVENGSPHQEAAEGAGPVPGRELMPENASGTRTSPSSR